VIGRSKLKAVKSLHGTMADNCSNSLRLVTYNLHGFNQGSILLNDLCNNFDLIAVQEHWLSTPELHKLINFNNNFQGFAWSAMSDKLQNGILVGRPFGGLGLLVNKFPLIMSLYLFNADISKRFPYIAHNCVLTL